MTVELFCHEFIHNLNTTIFVFRSSCPGACLGLDVRQSPSDLISKPGDKAKILCRHDRTDYYVMLWYQRSPGDTALKLIGYLYNKAVTMENSDRVNFNLSGDLSGNKKKEGALTIQVSGEEQVADYFCAAREARRLKTPSERDKKYTPPHYQWFCSRPTSQTPAAVAVLCY